MSMEQAHHPFFGCMGARKGTYDRARHVAANMKDAELIYTLKHEIPAAMTQRNIRSVIRQELRKRGYVFKRIIQDQFYDSDNKAWITQWSLDGPYKNGKLVS